MGAAIDQGRRAFRGRMIALAALSALGLPGCGDAGGALAWEPSDGVRVVDGPSTRIRPIVREAPDQLPAADPLLEGFDGWPLAFEVRHHDAARDACSVVIARAGATVRTLEGALSATGCEATWDGRDASGVVAPPGPLVATAVLTDASGAERARGQSAIEVVRLGIDRVQLGGAPGARAALLYRRTAGVDGGWYEIGVTHVPWQMAPDASEGGAGAPLELPDRTPRPRPAIAGDLLSPPLDPGSPDGVERDTFSLPTAWVAGSEIEARARLSSSIAATPRGGEPQAVEVRVVAPEGLAIEGEDRFTDGREIVLSTLGSPVPAVGRYDVEWRFGFEARRAAAAGAEPGEWQPIPGGATTSHRLYGLVAQPIFDSSAVPYRAWVDVVDAIAGWVGGETADPDEVGAALVAGIYETLGLRYDTARGASFYTEYTSGFSGAVFYLQHFLERDWGSIVNCTDSASILSAYANMIGLDFRYHILTNRAGLSVGFDLNYIRAIGMPAFDDTPFDSGRGGFRYHAIVGSRDGRTWDATLAVDGDGAPASPPHTLLLVQSLEPMAYLEALSSQARDIRTDLDEKVRLR